MTIIGKMLVGAMTMVGVATVAVTVVGVSALIGAGFIIDSCEKDGNYEIAWVPAEERKKNPGVYFRVKEVSETVETE